MKSPISPSTAVIGLLLLAACPLLAQHANDPNADPNQAVQPPTKKVQINVPSSVEEAMDAALKNNPDILHAEARVREAEAELNRTQQQVLGKIVTAIAELKAARQFQEETQKRLGMFERLRKNSKGTISELDILEAKMADAKYSGEVSRKEAELAVLVGLKIPGMNRPSSPSAMQTYLISGEGAHDLAKLLQDSYKDAPGVRISASATNQLMVYAPQSIQNEIDRYVKLREVEQKLSKRLQEIAEPQKVKLNLAYAMKLRKALEMPISYEVKDGNLTTVKETTTYFVDKLKSKNIGIDILTGNGPGDVVWTTSGAKFTEPVSLGTMIRIIEDMTDVNFVILDYGIVATRSPPHDALYVREFLKQKSESNPDKK